ncbi:MAG: hypothetical protein AAFY02_05045 [Pseudomonadota bacterium]
MGIRRLLSAVFLGAWLLLTLSAPAQARCDTIPYGLSCGTSLAPSQAFGLLTGPPSPYASNSLLAPGRQGGTSLLNSYDLPFADPPEPSLFGLPRSRGGSLLLEDPAPPQPTPHYGAAESLEEADGIWRTLPKEGKRQTNSRSLLR